METVYVIETRHGNRDYDDYCFKDRSKCEEIIHEWAVNKYGTPKYARNSDLVKEVQSYWRGDMSYEELKKLQKKKHKDAVNSALYYDYVDLYWIKELKIFEDDKNV